MLLPRDDVNLAFYGYKVSARQILLEGAVPQPPAASSLYNSLDRLMDKYENRRFLVHSSSAPAAVGGKGAAAAGVGGKHSSAAAEAGSSRSGQGVVATLAAFARASSSGQQQQQQRQQQGQHARSGQQGGWMGSAQVHGAQELPDAPMHPAQQQPQQQQQPEWRWYDDSDEERDQLPSLFD